jgi:hypothetical protein
MSTMSSGSAFSSRATNSRTFIGAPSFFRGPTQASPLTTTQGRLAALIHWAAMGLTLTARTRIPPVLLLMLDPISDRKCPSVRTVERVFVKVELTAGFAENASISSVIHQLDHRARCGYDPHWMNKYTRREPNHAPPMLASDLGNADNSGKVSSSPS